MEKESLGSQQADNAFKYLQLHTWNEQGSSSIDEESQKWQK